MIFSFLVSFFSFAHFRLGGEIYISELIFTLYLFLCNNKVRLLSEPLPRKILLFGGLWLISQIVTDLIRGTSTENILRGWASIIFFLLDFCAIYIIARRKPGSLRILVLGSALGVIFSVLLYPSDYSQVEPWKFGYGPPLTMLALLYLSTGNRYRAKYGQMLLVLLGVSSIYLNARSLGGLTILTAALLYLGQQFGYGRFAGQHSQPGRLFGLAAGAMLAVLCTLLAYQWFADSGYLPEKGAEKFQTYKSKDAGLPGLIFGSRPEIFISSQAVLDSPIIGHGSWAEDARYGNMYYAVIAALGWDVDEATLKDSVESSELIPTHSVLMQAWVWAGLLGAVFWIFILRIITHSAFFSFTEPHALQPLAIFSYVSAIWNLLFSPFGANQRFYWALAIVIIFIAGLRGISASKVANNIPED